MLYEIHGISKLYFIEVICVWAVAVHFPPSILDHVLYCSPTIAKTEIGELHLYDPEQGW